MLAIRSFQVWNLASSYSGQGETLSRKLAYLPATRLDQGSGNNVVAGVDSRLLENCSKSASEERQGVLRLYL